MTRILVLGCYGQVGWELVRSLQPLGEVIAAGRHLVDLAAASTLRAFVREARAEVIVNAAAYTAVDRAEDDEATALAVNGTAVGVLAEEAHRSGALVVHFSTDYVFNGTKSSPYVPDDAPAPVNAYGRTKLAGEAALSACGADFLCLRTSWVYAARGSNFLRTMLRLAAERRELRVVADQLGAPTSARLIADATAHAIRQSVAERRSGGFVPAILHLTAGGATSWHGFAGAIVETARATSAGARIVTERVIPIATEQYPLPAPRPRNSRLDCSAFEERFGLTLPHWLVGLRLCLAEVH